MRYLALALFSEGPSDQGFLQRIIYRVVHEAAAHATQEAFEIQEQFVPGNRYAQKALRADRIAAAFGELVVAGAINLVFIHTDGGADPIAAYDERVAPARQRLSCTSGQARFEVVGVVPVRETESWALADREALADELGWAGQLPSGLDQLVPADPEGITDPKAVLARLRTEAARGGRRRRREALSAIPPTLGERATLPALRRLTSFRRFEADTRAALARLWTVAE